MQQSPPPPPFQQPPPPPPERIPTGAKPVPKNRNKNLLILTIIGGLIFFAMVCVFFGSVAAVFLFRNQESGPAQTQVEAPPVTFDQQVVQPDTPQDQPADQPAAQAEGAPAQPPATNADHPWNDPNSHYYMSSPDYGIQAFLYWRPEVADRDLGLINDAGFRWVKQEFAWREIEGAAKGAYNWDNSDRMMEQIEGRNLKIMARVGVQPEWAGGDYPEIGPPDNYQDFADFVYELATRYKGKIGAYQIWNEPNLSREWGNRPVNPTEYTELLKVAYDAVKRADPDAIVISAGLAPTTRNDDVAMPDIYFVQGMYDAGAAPYFDMLGVHGAGYKAPPEMDPAEVAKDPNYANPGDFDAGVPEELRRIYCFRHVEDVRQVMVDNGDEAKRVVILEFGWTTDNRADSPYRWHHVGEDTQGEYAVRAYEYAKANWQPWIANMSIIYMPDVEWTDQDEQYYWSIVVPRWPDAWPKPAYHMIAAMPKD